MAKTVFALIFILIISASIPPHVFAAITRGARGPRPKPVTLGGLSLTPAIGEYFFAESEQREATQSYALKVGYDIMGESFANNIGIEGTLNYFTTTSKTDASDAIGYIFRLDAIYPFILGEKWMPFLAVGAGGIVIDDVLHAEKSPLLNFGAGLKYFLEDYLAVRADARRLVVYDNANTLNNFEVGIGMSYYFGKERKIKPVPPPAKKQDVKKPVVKDETPTAPAVPAVPATPPLVPPVLLAPLLALESAAKPLSRVGTPTETSGEKSVMGEESPSKAAAVSKPVSPAVETTAVDKFEMIDQSALAKDGEPVRLGAGEKVVRRLSINFDSGSSQIKPEYSDKLMEIADILKSSADTSARIEGHTDSTGKLSTNYNLSEQRVRSVRSSLMKFGVDPVIISGEFYGPSRPIADNATIEGRQKNRRVEILATLIARPPEIKDEQELLPSVKPEHRENERLQAEKYAKASIKAAIMLLEGRWLVSAGGTGSLPVEISNKGENSEEFLLTVTAPKEFDAILSRASKPDEKITRLQLAAGETFTGAIEFKMPPEMIDGHRSDIMINAASTKFSDISFQKKTIVICSAPVVRAVAKLAEQKVTPGEKLRYAVTVLNAGSLPAQNLTVRLHLPPQIDFQGTSDVSFKQESDGTLVFTVDQVEIGTLTEINLDVKVREDSAVGQELRGRVEVSYDNMQRKDIFTGSASVVQAK